MSLEAMKKEDLVKHARSLEQELKGIKEELEGLQAKVSELEKPKEESIELPFTAVSLIPKSNNNNHELVVIKYNRDGQAKIESVKEYEYHLATFHAETIMLKFDKTNRSKKK